MRLKRLGTKMRPYYRIVVMDSRSPRDGKTIDELGLYHPIEKENQVRIDREKVYHWISQGAQVTKTVKSILNKHDIYLGK